MKFSEKLYNKIWEILTYSVLSPYYRNNVSRLGLRGDEKVLDFGCGVGGASRYFAQSLSRGDGHLTCIDISPGLIETAKKRLSRYTNVDYLLGDIREFSLDAGSYDIIFMSLVLYHMDPGMRGPIISELARILDDSGRIVIRQFIGGESSISPQEIRDLMAESGLKEVHSEQVRSLAMIATYTVFDTPFTVEAEREYITNFPSRGIFHVAVNRQDQKIVGFQSMEPFASYTYAFDHVGVVGTYVDLSYRRQGIGRRLFQATFDAARRKGYQKIFTYVRADNEAALVSYCKQGFEVVGTARQQAYINGKYVDEVIIEKFL
jgi:L-amino acid N-acyltransferase YncA/2-polyprenyl-3-methyl-5-hydroxy-6-metoxy-1,4-benzoquinol methylase